MRGGLVCLALLFLAITPCRAHVEATGLATIETRDDAVAYTLILLTADLPEIAARMLQAAADGDQANAQRVADLARAAVRIGVAEQACHPGRVRIQGSRANDAKISLGILFTCPVTGGSLILREDWSTLFGAHYRTIASVRRADGTREAVLDADHPELRLDLVAPAGGWRDFILLGMTHILTGFDHLLFLLALLVHQRRFWPVVRIATAFTLAHSATLSLAVLHWIALRDGIVEPAIAASIVWVAVENLFFPMNGWRRVGIAFLFGLVHGLGFASALTELDLSGVALARALVGFNLGVELAQVACIGIALPLLIWLSGSRVLPWLPRAVSVLVALAGGFWFVERVLGW